MQDDVLELDAIDGSMVGVVGGKGAQLGALATIDEAPGASRKRRTVVGLLDEKG